MRKKILVLAVGLPVWVLCPGEILAQNMTPVADAGLPGYAAADPVKLDGTGSYDPDNSGPLSYAWRQIAGVSVTITDANRAFPTISGFVQTSEIQECEFELVVSDGELTSSPHTVKVIIVPYFGASTLQQENPPFDPNKPTVFYFGGGDCAIGFAGQLWNASAWKSRANVMSFPNGYGPDSGGGARTYYKYGDMIIVYLSAVAPDYKQPIQTIGWSTGGMPAIDAGIHLNRVYRDARYAINRVTHLDAGCRVVGLGWDFYSDNAGLFQTSSVAGEQCWIEFYAGTEGEAYEPYPLRGFLLVSSRLSHSNVRDWYRNSLTGSAMNNFNSGVVAGAYWSIIGPGKNLQLAPQTDAYYFRWDGTQTSGTMGFYNEGVYPGRLPEPVTLVGPTYVEDARGYIFTCEESQNAVGYELLVGSDPYRVMDYEVISDTPAPPNEVITILPCKATYWTVRVRDQYGSTIYADPEYIDPALGMADFDRNGRVDFEDFAIFAGRAYGDGKLKAKALAVLAEYWLADVLVFAHWEMDEQEGNIAHESVGNKDGTVHGDPNWQPSGGKVGGALELDAVNDYVSTAFVLDPADGAFSVFAWVKGGSPGQVVISQTDGAGMGRSWLAADSSGGELMTGVRKVGRGGAPLISEFVVTDGDWHRVGLVWDGSYRHLYADDEEVAVDTVLLETLESADGGLHFGADNTLAAASFFSGLIDDVRIYDQAITP